MSELREEQYEDADDPYVYADGIGYNLDGNTLTYDSRIIPLELIPFLFALLKKGIDCEMIKVTDSLWVWMDHGDVYHKNRYDDSVYISVAGFTGIVEFLRIHRPNTLKTVFKQFQEEVVWPKEQP